MATKVVQGPKGANADSLTVPLKHLEFTGAASTWAGQNGIGGAADDDLEFKPPLRSIEVLTTDGSLVVKYAVDGVDGSSVSLTGKKDSELQGQFVYIDHTSTAVGIRVAW